MEKAETKILLVLGCQRSGTTLLAAMLGRHSEINMLFESFTKDVFKGIGKKYSGNKLLTWRQIRLNQRGSKLGHLINRIVNLHIFSRTDHHKVRIYPNASLSIQDYLDKGATIVTITRSKEEVINSITRRTTIKKARAIKEYDLAMKELQAIQANAINVTFSDLVKNPADTLKRICKELDLDYEPKMLEGPKYNFVYPHSKVLSEKSKEQPLVK